MKVVIEGPMKPTLIGSRGAAALFVFVSAVANIAFVKFPVLVNVLLRVDIVAITCC